MARSTAAPGAWEAPAYWRSLEQRADDPRVRDHYEREFLEGASEAPEGLSRREVLQLTAASVSLASLAACRRPVEHIVPFVQAPELMVPGIPRHYATTLPFRHEALGLLVESHEGRPTKVEGNELHPSTLGSSSLWMQASILDLYDPDRSRALLAAGEPSTWEAFTAAWGDIAAGLVQSGGQGLAILAESFSSPTLARLQRDAQERFPQARWATWEPISEANAEAGASRAAGVALVPDPHYERARVILAVDSDFLGTEAGVVLATRRYAASRAVDDASPSSSGMSRLYVAEGIHSLTGANADHRIRVRSSRIGAFVAALAAELARQGLGVSAPASASPVEGVSAEQLRVLAADLLAHRGESLIVAGRRQPPVVHAAVLELNAALGNVGRTIEYRIPRHRQESGETLAELVEAMGAGRVETLVILGANPVYSAPGDLAFAEALSGVANVLHLGGHVDETAAASKWHVPRAHPLETWADASAADGTLSIVQPLIAPLWDGKSEIELLNLVAGGEDRSGYDLVRQTWSGLLGSEPGSESFESRWLQTLHDGVAEGTAEPAAEAPVSSGALQELASSPAPGGGEGLEIVFAASPALFDGRFANNAWLQELPHPITKMTWDNAALLSPATARTLGVENEEIVTVSVEGREIELPVWIVPGQADETVVVELGYGRTGAGRVGDGVGANASVIRTSRSLDYAQGATVRSTGRRHLVAQTQDHHGMEGRPLVRAAALDHFRDHPHFAAEMVHTLPPSTLWSEWTYEEGSHPPPGVRERVAVDVPVYQWGMAIDLNACTGCNACVIACQSENNIPAVGRDQVRRGREMHWIRLDRYFSGSEDEPETVFQPVPCMHCENAPCEQVCPVAATVHDAEGINAMVYNRCIGTRYCSNNCPYKVRRFNYYHFTKHTPEVVALANNPDVTVRSRGVMEKCTYCTQRINAAKIAAKREDRPVADGEVRTACQQACPAQAISFGNILDEGSVVATHKRSPRNYGMLDEVVYTRPRTTYLAKLRNPSAELAPPAAPGADPAHGATGGDESDAAAGGAEGHG
ncbi:MAG TPA: TAT-variant-translocated molybdopterin oxidoreductase [Thermoanaerobaculia bacterium]|nr:TAT-variant-translocated molybdopterin oxidoreductase [Thermoanaerobaculia bacterium]